METGKAPAQRNAELMLVTEAIRWRKELERFAPERLEEFDANLRRAVENPAPLPARKG